MNLLALESYYGGSHRAFLDGWIANSDHQFHVLDLPAHKWKWRMRHAAVTFAERLRSPELQSQSFDALWCSDMLGLAEFVGLADQKWRAIPKILYMHENQITYPVRESQKRDFHFGYTNFTSCLAADRVWFNSEFHLREFLSALRGYLGRMPDYASVEAVDEIESKSEVQYPGITAFPKQEERDPGPIRIAWNARWEFDKNPADFFAALRMLKRDRVDFQLIMLGESFRNQPEEFKSAELEFSEEILQWGYASSKDEYRKWLTQADVVVSTAIHEFFGIGIVEGVAAGALPIVPDRLAYPDVLEQLNLPAELGTLKYGQTTEELADCLRAIDEILMKSPCSKSVVQDSAAKFAWARRAAVMDQRVQAAFET